MGRARWYKTEAQFMEDVRRLELEDIEKQGGNTLASKKPAAAADDSSTMSPKSADDNSSSLLNNISPMDNQFANKIDAQIEENGGPTGIMVFIAAKGFWRNPEDIYWVPRYGMLFDRYSENFKVWLVWEVIFSFIIGIIDGIAPDSTAFCKAKSIVLILLYVANMLIFWAFRPFRRAWWNGMFCFAYFLTFLAAALIGDGVMKGDPEASTIESGMTCIIFHTVILFVMAILDLIMGIAGVVGIQDLLKLRVTGRIDEAKNQKDVVQNTEEMKVQMARDDFNGMMDQHSRHQAIEHQVELKRAEAEAKMKSRVRNVVNAEAEFNPFESKAQQEKNNKVEFTQEEMDFI